MHLVNPKKLATIAVVIFIFFNSVNQVQDKVL
jgi:hypothetical protein